MHRDTNLWRSNSSRRLRTSAPRIRLHDRLAPPDESLPVAGICSSGRVSARPIRKARISPLSKSLGRPSRKRPAWITKSPRRGDSWTRTASTAFARKPAAITRISGLLIPRNLIPRNLYHSLSLCPVWQIPMYLLVPADFPPLGHRAKPLYLFSAPFVPYFSFSLCSTSSISFPSLFFSFSFSSREPTLSRITVSAMLLCQSGEWRRKTILYLAGKSRIPFSILWPVRSQRDTMAVVSTRRQKFNR